MSCGFAKLGVEPCDKGVTISYKKRREKEASTLQNYLIIVINWG
jgi:hypothetical protein